MVPVFDALGFPCSYGVDVSPEFPGDGNWSCPVLGFDAQGQSAEPFASSWGTALVLRILPTSSIEWVATFAAGGLGGITGCYGTPSPRHLIALSDGSGHVVDVASRVVADHVPLDPILQVARVPGRDLVLLAGSVAVTAYGPAGRAWQTRRLAILDGLAMEQVTAERVRCRGDRMGATVGLELDTETGEEVAGPDFR